MAITYTYAGLFGDIVIDFTAQEINCAATIDTLTVQEIVNACRAAEDSVDGITCPKILNAAGKDYLDIVNGVQVGITCVLLDNWVVYSQKTSGVFRVLGGNLVQVSGGDVFKPNTHVTEVNILSAASTIVTVSSGSGLSGEEHAQLMGLPGTTLETDERAALLAAATGTEVSEVNSAVSTVNAAVEAVDIKVDMLTVNTAAVQSSVDVVDGIVDQLLSGQLTKEDFKKYMFNRTNTVAAQKITSYAAGDDVTVNVTYDADGVPTSEAISA